MEYSASDYPNNRSFVYSRKLKDTTVVSENVSKIYEINEKNRKKEEEVSRKLNNSKGFK